MPLYLNKPKLDNLANEIWNRRNAFGANSRLMNSKRAKINARLKNPDQPYGYFEDLIGRHPRSEPEIGT